MRKNKRIIAMVMLLILTVGIIPLKVRANTRNLPAKPSLSHNQWGTDVDGNYDLTSNLWYGNNATSYKIYERFGPKGEFTVIDEGTLTDSTPSPQSTLTEVRGRSKAGIYYYYAEYINGSGAIKSDIIEVTVGSVGKENIIINKVDDEGIQVQFTIGQETAEYELTNSKNNSPKFSVISNNMDVAKAEIVGNKLKVTGLSHGRSGLKIVDEKTGDVRHIGVRVKKKNGELPGMPEYLSMGQVSEDRDEDLAFWRDVDTDYTNKRTDVRYIYINGGPLTGWRTWTTEDGARAKTFINESLKQGMIPFFVYYNIPDDGESYELDLQHINDPKYMDAYFKDLKFFLDICREYGKDETVGIIFEPDFLGYMMQQANKAPDNIPALVETAYTSGILEKGKDPEFSNSVKGLVECINYIVDKYYKEAYYGWQFNIWSYSSHEIPNQGLLHKTEFLGWEPGREFIKQVAKETADFYKSAGVTSYGADFISIDKYGLDGAFETGAPEDPEKSKWFWNADIWNNYLLYTKTLHEVTELPAILWQIPVGHINGSTEVSPYTNKPFNELLNKPGNYEDSAATYFFGDTFKTSGKRLEYFKKNEANDPKIKVSGDTVTWGDHMTETRDAGIVSVLFGAGVGASTDAVGSPPTDDYFWITKAQHYYDNVVMLNGGGGGGIVPPVEKPLAPTIEASSLNANGNYSVTAKIPANSKGTRYKIYENGKTIKEGALNSFAQDIKVDIVNKPTGDYMYKAEIFNDKASSSSLIITVKVNNTVVPPVDIPLKGSIEVDKASNDGNYTLTAKIPANSKATSYQIIEDGKIIKSGSVDKNAQTIVENFKNKAKGEYNYTLVLSNKDGKTESDKLTVKVTSSEVVENDVKVDFNITSDWGSGANYDLVITNNTKKPLKDWKLTFKCDKKITSNWNADLKDLGNGMYELAPKAWNNTLGVGEKIALGGACDGGDTNLKIYDIKVSFK